MTIRILGLVSTLSILAAACVDTAPEAEAPGARTLSLSFVDLPDLAPDFVFEGWLIVDGAPVTTGRFDADVSTQSFDFTLDKNTADATTFVLTVEPAENDDPAPSHVHLLAGDLANDQADLSIAHPAALNTDFASATGGYLLETPSDDVAENYADGIWYVDGLDLPTLPEGWAYEGWVVVDGAPISTGRFLDPNLADHDGAGPTAGPNTTPPYPGQDFVDPAMSLIGATVVLTVEPEPDNAPTPFVLKPLIDASVEDVGAGTLQSMVFQETAPIGTAVIQ